MEELDLTFGERQTQVLVSGSGRLVRDFQAAGLPLDVLENWLETEEFEITQ